MCYSYGMENVVENLRLLLWRECKTLPRSHWAEQLAHWASCPLERAKDLLTRGRLSQAEQERIAEILHISEEDLVSARLIEQEDVLRENMRYLISGLDYGGPRRLAEAVGVSPATVSQWGTGAHKPTSKWFGPICDFFGIARTTDLEAKAFFLSLEPITGQARKAWLKERIDQLPPEVLQELFPALRRLLGDQS